MHDCISFVFVALLRPLLLLLFWCLFGSVVFLFLFFFLLYFLELCVFFIRFKVLAWFVLVCLISFCHNLLFDVFSLFRLSFNVILCDARFLRVACNISESGRRRRSCCSISSSRRKLNEEWLLFFWHIDISVYLFWQRWWWRQRPRRGDAFFSFACLSCWFVFRFSFLFTRKFATIVLVSACPFRLI